MAYLNFLYQYWKEEQQVFNKNLAILKEHSDKDAVHDLRVAVKKLRATLEIYVLLTKEPLWDYPLKETENLFTICGKQRDIEISLEVLTLLEKETSKKYQEFNRFLNSLLRTAIKWTSKAVTEYKKKELGAIATLLKTERSENIQTDLVSVIKTQLPECRNYYKKPHRLRQFLKEIYYWIKMIPGSSEEVKQYEKTIHDVLDDLGHWQDLKMFETRLRHFRKDYLPKAFSEYNQIEDLQKLIKEKEQKLLRKALGKIRQLVKKITTTENGKQVLIRT